jgi:hypothetical protein
MAAMTTALTEYSDKENSRVYVYTGHSVNKPKKVLQRRKEPTGGQEIIEDVITVYNGTEDSNGDYLDSRVTFTLTLRRPKDGIAADVTAALAVLRDIVASDEYTAVTTGSTYLS